MRRILSLVMVAAATSVSSAAITEIAVNKATGDGPVVTEQGMVNTISISFEGEYTGSQLLIELTQGSIYQDSSGTQLPPKELFVGVFPSLANDTFVAQGGRTEETTISLISTGGGAVNLGGAPGAVFSEAAINQQYNLTAGAEQIFDATDLITAQVTLSPDAEGSWRYLASADGIFGVVSGRVGDEGDTGTNFGFGMDGCIVGGNMWWIPEPSSFSTAALALLGFVGVRRRNG